MGLLCVGNATLQVHHLEGGGDPVRVGVWDQARLSLEKRYVRRCHDDDNYVFKSFYMEADCGTTSLGGPDQAMELELKPSLASWSSCRKSRSRLESASGLQG